MDRTFKQQSFQDSEGSYGKIKDGDNFLRIFPHKDFQNPNVNWFSEKHRYFIDKKHFGVKLPKEEKPYHTSLSGVYHNYFGYDKEACLLGLYRGFIFDFVRERYEEKEDKVNFYKKYMFNPQRRVVFYAVRYESYPDPDIIRLFDLPLSTFDTLREYMAGVSGIDNKVTHPDSAFIFNAKRSESLPKTYAFSHKTDKGKTSDGKNAQIDVENRLTDRQIESLQSLPTVDSLFANKYNMRDFDNQFSFLQWYDSNVWVKCDPKAKSILNSEAFKKGFKKVKEGVESGDECRENAKTKRKTMASDATSGVITDGNSNESTSSDSDDLPF